MIAKFYGRSYSLQALRAKGHTGRSTGSLLDISHTAERIGFQASGVRLSFAQLSTEATLPCVVTWDDGHLVVVHGFQKRRFFRGTRHARPSVKVAVPTKGLLTYSYEEFAAGWLGANPEAPDRGAVLLLEPTPEFYLDRTDAEPGQQAGLREAFAYLLKYKRLLVQLLLGLVVGSGLQLFLPFLAQSVVDIGVNTHNLNFVYLILIAQVTLFTSQNIVDFIRGWILLHISSRVNVLILSGFLSKLLRLPISYFDTTPFGDIMQRFKDHERIELFLTSTSLQAVFSTINIIIFGLVLCLYDTTIFYVFAVGTVAYVFWVLLFRHTRRRINVQRFRAESRNQGAIVQLIQGVQDVKLSNSERQRRWDWEQIQVSLFKLNYQGLAVKQYQKAGAVFLNEGKNILITFLAAKAVIDGHLTLGSMITVQYILGQLNKPMDQIILFLETWQDAQFSLERLNQIQQLDDEELASDLSTPTLPANHALTLTNVSFAYPGEAATPVLHDITLHIPAGKTTAVVGASGSGKTTLLKLLLRFYPPTSGRIQVGHAALDRVSQHAWRGACGVVMQDGFIFSDTIARNIALGDEHPDVERLLHALHVASIADFVEALPLGLNTKIGMDGNGMSQGQRQRLLIARAVYKDPAFLFLDEATNALDTTNESAILRNMDEFLAERTVVVVAHRLSTVRHADNIVVMQQGRIVEQGTHEDLVALQGQYFALVKNQLELDA
ncbi:ATP-binding cassette subfamily B protein [Hymenobacter sp. UYAg731]